MNSHSLTIGLIMLLVGAGVGYAIASTRVGTPATNSTYVMSDGSTMSDAMSGMTAGLAGKTRDEFDRAFINEMIVHHEGAVAMAEQALRLAKHDEIKQMAQEIIAAQTREINTMRGWLQSWYGVR